MCAVCAATAAGGGHAERALHGGSRLRPDFLLGTLQRNAIEHAFHLDRWIWHAGRRRHMHRDRIRSDHLYGELAETGGQHIAALTQRNRWAAVRSGHFSFQWMLLSKARSKARQGSVSMAAETYAFREFLEGVISPVAVSVIDRMSDQIGEIYSLSEILTTRLPSDLRIEHQQRFTSRLKRIVSMLPPDVSPMANEVFTAIEFLIYEIHGEPVKVGIALARLEELGDEIRSDPLLHDLIIGRAN